MSRVLPALCAIVLGAMLTYQNASAAEPAVGTRAAEASPRFEVSFPASLHQQPVTGRLFIMIANKNTPEVRLQRYWFDAPQFLGVSVVQWKPGEVVTVDAGSLGYPFRSLVEVPPGDYYVQASLNVQQEYRRADGHTVWAADQWDGHRFNASPANLYSAVRKMHLDASQNYHEQLSLTDIVGPASAPADTPWVKYVKIRSDLLSRFWGRPIYLGAAVLLPRDYELNPKVRYPVIYQQQAHFNYRAPFDFVTEDLPEGRAQYERECRGACETGFEFYRAWIGDGFPRMIAVVLQHPTPYADFSDAINSENNGPYGDAIVRELIPYVEQHFRAIGKPYARVLVGKSLGGRDALAQELHYPGFYGGAWIFYPWGISFKHFSTLNIYERDNAFEITSPESAVWKGFWSQPEWFPLERPFVRTADGQPLASLRQLNQVDAVLDPKTGGEFGAENANFGPVADDGYPKPLWNRLTGQIDHEVADVWRQNDLTNYAEKNWPRIGPQLVGKLHFYVGDADEYYRYRGVRAFEAVLQNAKPDARASFEYAPLSGHGWQPMSNAALVAAMAKQIAANTPREAHR
jgi:hypothetical protein